MSRERILLVSGRNEFVSFCQSAFQDGFIFLNVATDNFDFIHPEFFLVSAVLLDAFNLSSLKISFLAEFFKNTLDRPVFICREKSDCIRFVSALPGRTKKYPPLDMEFSGEKSVESPSHSLREARSRSYSALLEAACRSDSTVLLLGESGSGKTYTARFIHDNSKRKNKKFTPFNLAEINPNLIESSLFGSTKGSFTDAAEKTGILEEAEDGTLFIDEIAALSLDGQGKFLGVLDSREFCRVGSSRKRPLNARLIFATDGRIHELMEKNLFKRQLFYRISVLVITVPPLRERKDEIAGIAEKTASEFKKKLSSCAVEKLVDFSWPGNIRQLKNCIECACVCTKGDTIFARDIIFF
ncbi:sigma-54-dependent transcriptional regulator [Treponema sp.]|uniref:sigma-54-dependent transcriptional regulator n=1 Tax=Treponema sp. TaxID=166 RepID=UPI003F020E98